LTHAPGKSKPRGPRLGRRMRQPGSARRRNGVKEDGDEQVANSLYLPRRYVDP
jgi:hypothetical protein